MQLPFTVHEFFDVFRRYNETVWPAQLLLVAAALTAVGLVLRLGTRASRAVSLILAIFWLWMGGVYHLWFFRAINPAALLFGIAFVMQGVALLWMGLRGHQLQFGLRRGGTVLVGGLLMAYALAIYPLLGYTLGHRFPASPTFGVPCPTTIFTFGMLCWTRAPVPSLLLIVPGLWALIATFAASQLGVSEDYGLLIAAILTLPILLRRTALEGAP